MGSLDMGIPISEGFVDFAVKAAGQPCRTWYKTVGDIHNPRHRPCVLLHGGPGMGHNYLLSLTDLATHFGIPVIFYDQLGCGKSTLLPEKSGDGTFWTCDLFLNELENLLSSLRITSYDMFGNSWGGMLGAMHALRQPHGLRRLIVANSPTDMHMWVAAANHLRTRLPCHIQHTLLHHEQKGTTDSEEYETAVFEFYKRHVCRVDPMPKELLDSLENVKIDPTVYHTMNGPSEFHVIGTLKDWVITPRQIAAISVPTLLINGAHDEATDEVVMPWFKALPNAKWTQFAHSSHTPHWEERERFMAVVSDFLNE